MQEANRPTCARYAGHIHVAPELMPKDIKTMSDEERNLTRECSQLHFTATSTVARTDEGLAHTHAQVDYMSRKDRIEQLEVAPAATNADQLLKSFSNRPDVCWAMMTFNPDVGVLLQATVKDWKEQMKLDRNEKQTLFVTKDVAHLSLCYRRGNAAAANASSINIL